MKFSEALDCLENPENYDWTYDGKSVRVIVDSYSDLTDGNLFVCGFEYGPSYLIAARSYEAAWEAWVDEMPTIPEDELIEAYGPEGTPNGSFLDMAVKAYRPDVAPSKWDWTVIRAHAKRMLDEYTIHGERYPELIEGYEQQSNASGTGIVSMGHYAGMNEADNALVEFSARKG